MKSHMRACLHLIAVVLALQLFANATFPGKNGRIAFVQDGNIFTMNPDGSDIRQLTNLGPDTVASWEAWSADGRLIVFNEFSAPDFIGQIWLMNADGTNQHLVLAEANSSEERPSFSPDGSTILFSRCPLDLPESCGVSRVNVTGTGLTQITVPEPAVRTRGPVYSPDGTTISVQFAGRDGVIANVTVMNADGSNIRILTPAEISGWRQNWSPDGRSIAFSTHCCNPQNEEVWVVKPNGNGLHALTNNGNNYFSGPHDFNPSWSPEGNAIAFERYAPDFSSGGIWVLKLTGPGEKQITALSHPTRHPQASRRGQLTGLNRGGRNRLMEIEEGGALPRWGAQPQ